MELFRLKKVVTGCRDGKLTLTIEPAGKIIKQPESSDDHWAVASWISASPHTAEGEDLAPTWQERMPPAQGSAFRLFQFAPAGRPGSSGKFHVTHSVDYVVIISGHVWLCLEDGQEVELGSGDTVVQRGTNHRWENRADVPCFAASVMISAEQD